MLQRWGPPVTENVVSQMLNPGGSKIQKKRKKKNLIQDGQGPASKLIKVSKGPQESQMPYVSGGSSIKDGQGPASKLIKVFKGPQESDVPCVSGDSSTNTFQTNCKPDIKPLVSQFLEWVENNKEEYAAEASNLCTKCNITFNTSELLNDHIEKAHTEHSFKCPDCTKNFPTPGGVSEHRIMMHKAQKIYQCSQCNAIVNNASLLTLHYSIHHELSKCSQCRKWLSSFQLLKQHQWEVHNIEKPFTCVVCSQNFFDFTKFTKHRKSHMLESQTAQLLFRCPDCNKTFPNTGVLNQHYRNDHGLAKCSECSKEISSLVLLQKHKWDVHKLLTCAVCRETFIDFNQYKEHRETHTLESTVSNPTLNPTLKKPAQLGFSCPDCNKIFPSTGVLNRHYSNDHGLAKCCECGEDFPSLVLLQKHKWNAHKLLTCAVCRETFINFNQYKEHRETHTVASTVSNSPFKNPAQLSFRCPDCNKTFPSTVVLNQHYGMDHGFAKCSECSEEFSSLVRLKKHKHDVHKLLTCAVCRETFINFFQYKKHRETHMFESTVSNSTFKKPAKLRFRCPDCNKTFESTVVLNQHYSTDHGFAKCSECSEEFSSLVRLKKHKHDVHKLLTCAVCRETFINFYQYEKHRETHTFESTVSNSPFKKPAQLRFRCPECNATFPNTGVLNQHYRINHGFAKCFECIQEFSSLVLLKKHNYDVHKLLTCAVCRQTFINFNHYKNHRETHTFESTLSNSTFVKPEMVQINFRCPDCYNTFLSSDALDQHYSYYHGLAKCFECSEEFSTLFLLKKHKWDVHKLITCAVCRETFTDFIIFNKHREIHTFECTVCNSLFKTPALLRQHKQIHVLGESF